jgi:peptidoglycan hydrolase-like protein with peptidoglycan-binding domain
MKFGVRFRPGILILMAVLAGTASLAETSSASSKKKATNSGKTTTHRKATPHSGSRKGKRAKRVSWRNRQQKMDGERVRQVQEALIREHYLTGQPTGVWDQKSQNAMVRLQGENGWQTKVVPDSRALIKLGLGPSNDHLINPESAITSPLQPGSALQHSAPVSTPVNPASGVVDPVSTPQN